MLVHAGDRVSINLWQKKVNLYTMYNFVVFNVNKRRRYYLNKRRKKIDRENKYVEKKEKEITKQQQQERNN